MRTLFDSTQSQEYKSEPEVSVQEIALVREGDELLLIIEFIIVVIHTSGKCLTDDLWGNQVI